MNELLTLADREESDYNEEKHNLYSRPFNS
jgi:hypothetical protein